MTNSLVIDASVMIKLLLPNDQQIHIQQLMADWHKAQYHISAPSLWRYETTSALTKAVHFKLLTVAEAQQALELLKIFEIELVIPDANLVDLAVDWTLRLKRAAAYDSFYVALAEHLKTELWTADKRLYHAVKQDWVCYAGIMNGPSG